MNGTIDVSEDRSTSPAEAFSLLGNELRVSILTTLGDAKEGSEPESLTFEELRRRCEVSDSGRFNYHLQELLGVFVTEKDDGYDLLYPGVRLYRAIKADSFTDRTTVDSFPVDASCDDCGADLEATYRNSHLVVRCSACDHVAFKYYVPPGAVRSGDPETVLRAANAFGRRDIVTVARDVCPTCGSEMHHDVVPEEEKASDLEHLVDGPAVVHHCSYCENFFCTSVPSVLTYHPDVIGFLTARGVDVLGAPLWDLDQWDSDAVTVTDSDPLRLTVEFEADGDRLTATVDGDLRVLDTDRP